ncbi:hypothetical protein Y032_0266g709 [Ancylostoma ceylanicum]|uniref:Uncharacterized protein n=1 Tax=Ancylostoma ceylanicum TaxID=53326 RepID=A0A016S9D2_9BILA|nr:hypothetical protein Y032_0266g709 [Ancylostoma ceylanicum]
MKSSHPLPPPPGCRALYLEWAAQTCLLLGQLKAAPTEKFTLEISEYSGLVEYCWWNFGASVNFDAPQA